jgi:hypothetical protein
MPAFRQVKSRGGNLTSRLTQALQGRSQVIRQFDSKLTSESNSQNRGRFVLEYPEFIPAKPRRRQKISYPILSDLLNYTLNSSFVNITFQLQQNIRSILKAPLRADILPSSKTRDKWD